MPKKKSLSSICEKKLLQKIEVRTVFYINMLKCDF